MSLTKSFMTSFNSRHRVGINPDNVSAVIAALLGDLTAVGLLAGFARIFNRYKYAQWLTPAVFSILLLFLPVFIFVAKKNEYVKDMLTRGWIPISIALGISLCGGVIFDYGVNRFRMMAVFQPIVTSVGSNLVAVQCCRISTYLHQRYPLNKSSRSSSLVSSISENGKEDNIKNYRICQSPFSAYFSSSESIGLLDD